MPEPPAPVAVRKNRRSRRGRCRAIRRRHSRCFAVFPSLYSCDVWFIAETYNITTLDISAIISLINHYPIVRLYLLYFCIITPIIIASDPQDLKLKNKIDSVRSWKALPVRYSSLLFLCDRTREVCIDLDCCNACWIELLVEASSLLLWSGCLQKIFSISSFVTDVRRDTASVTYIQKILDHQVLFG